MAQGVICGPDPARYIAAILQAVEAGYTHVWLHQIGPDQAGFFEFYACGILPKLRVRAGSTLAHNHYAFPKA
jgi:coenzyme F420-dependent glucose-6-phosphate dehydrogenase